MEQMGWIQLHRKFIDWEWYDDINTKVLFIHCLLKANHTDKKWRGIDIKRGDFLTSLNHLSSETGLSVRSIRTSLTRLESTGEVTRKATSKMTQLTICKYDTYNNLKKSNDTVNDTNADSVTTSKRHSDDKQTTTTKNDNNKKNEEKEVIDYLNSKVGKKFKTAKGLKARFNEGYTVDDAKKVIDIKVTEWSNDDKMKIYLRPQTLFSENFDGYLNQELKSDPKKFDFKNWRPN